MGAGQWGLGVSQSGTTLSLAYKFSISAYFLTSHLAPHTSVYSSEDLVAPQCALAPWLRTAVLELNNSGEDSFIKDK